MTASLTLTARAAPGAGKNSVEIIDQPRLDLGDEAGGCWPELRVRVTAAPEKGKANSAIVKLVAKAFGVPKSAVRLVGGEKSRIKTIEIDMDPAAAAAAIGRIRKGDSRAGG
ncbi:MAG: DUF167 domain-containing protein [Parvularculaceae bacterium]